MEPTTNEEERQLRAQLRADIDAQVDQVSTARTQSVLDRANGTVASPLQNQSQRRSRRPALLVAACVLLVGLGATAYVWLSDDDSSELVATTASGDEPTEVDSVEEEPSAPANSVTETEPPLAFDDILGLARVGDRSYHDLEGLVLESSDVVVARVEGPFASSSRILPVDQAGAPTAVYLQVAEVTETLVGEIEAGTALTISRTGVDITDSEISARLAAGAIRLSEEGVSALPGGDYLLFLRSSDSIIGAQPRDVFFVVGGYEGALDVEGGIARLADTPQVPVGLEVDHTVFEFANRTIDPGLSEVSLADLRDTVRALGDVGIGAVGDSGNAAVDFDVEPVGVDYVVTVKVEGGASSQLLPVVQCYHEANSSAACGSTVVFVELDGSGVGTAEFQVEDGRLVPGGEPCSEASPPCVLVVANGEVTLADFPLDLWQ